MKKEQKEYGWKSTKPPCSCGFVAPCVLNILKLLDVKRVLDVGCGNGALCGMLHDAGFDVVGADADKNGCALARAEYPDILFFEVGVYDEPDPVLGNPPKNLIVLFRRKSLSTCMPHAICRNSLQECYGRMDILFSAHRIMVI